MLQHHLSQKNKSWLQQTLMNGKSQEQQEHFGCDYQDADTSCQFWRSFQIGFELLIFFADFMK